MRHPSLRGRRKSTPAVPRPVNSPSRSAPPCGQSVRHCESPEACRGVGRRRRSRIAGADRETGGAESARVLAGPDGASNHLRESFLRMPPRPHQRAVSLQIHGNGFRRHPCKIHSFDPQVQNPSPTPRAGAAGAVPAGGGSAEMTRPQLPARGRRGLSPGVAGPPISRLGPQRSCPTFGLASLATRRPSRRAERRGVKSGNLYQP